MGDFAQGCPSSKWQSQNSIPGPLKLTEGKQTVEPFLNLPLPPILAEDPADSRAAPSPGCCPGWV